jgi:FtsP/CotA-like multicopper oxidase with cupredoxin domain
MTDQDLFTTETAGLTPVSTPGTTRLRDGDRLQLRISSVRKTLEGAELRMLAYNGSVPGPTLHVDQGSEITVDIRNEGDVETTVHWHGLRLENRFDGVPHETQAPIPVGGGYSCQVQFPDAGFYWTTRTSGRTTPRRWACTAPSWSNLPTRRTGPPSTGS